MGRSVVDTLELAEQQDNHPLQGDRGPLRPRGVSWERSRCRPAPCTPLVTGELGGARLL